MVGTTRLARAIAVLLWMTAVATMLASYGVVPFPTSDQQLQAAVTPGFATVGMLIVWRRPTISVGWLMLGMGGLPALAGLLGADVLVQNGAVLVCLVLVLVVFPDGRVPSNMWWIPVGLLGVGWIVAAVIPDFTWARSDGFEVSMGVALALAGVLWCGAAPFARRSRAGHTERLQLRWLGATAALTAAWAIVALLGVALSAPDWLVSFAGLITALLGGLGLPVSILVAVLRYRLYDIDRLVSRTVTYTLVVGLLAAVYAGATLLLTLVLPGDSSVAVATSTLAVFALFTPLRSNIQRRVDRRFNRTRYRAEEELEAFMGRIRATADFEGMQLDLEGLVQRTVQPSTLGIWIKRGSPGAVP